MDLYLHDTEGLTCTVGTIKEEPVWFQECELASRPKVESTVSNSAHEYYSPWVTYMNTFTDDPYVAEYGNIKLETPDCTGNYSRQFGNSSVDPAPSVWKRPREQWYQGAAIKLTRMSSTDTPGMFTSLDRYEPPSVQIKQEPNMAEVMLPMESLSAPKRRAGTKRKKGEGKSKSGNSSSYTTVPLPPCKVCSGVATGFHFGVITCEACKAFFRRALIHKQEYKCMKNDDCEIIDKKLGNCSACRLKKCFTLGMSKGGVRRGRYSIAIRTKAIVEAKALESRAAAAESQIQTHKRMRTESEDSFTDSLLMYPESNASFDSVSTSFDSVSPSFGSVSSSFGSVTHSAEVASLDPSFSEGYLDLSDLDSYSLTVTINDLPEQPASFQKNHELECLIDALSSCQEAVYPTIAKQFMFNMEDVQYKVYEEFALKQELFGDLFGKTETVSTEEYQQIFAETGIDLDDRLLHFNKKGKSMEESIAQYVNFAKIIPGFKNLNPKDVSRLLKAAHLEFWLFGNFKLMNEQLKVCSSWDGSTGTSIEHMSKFFDRGLIERFFQFSTSLKKLDLTIEELAIIRVILLTYTDRCILLDAEKIQTLQDKFVECLQYHLTKTSPEPMVRLAQIFDRLLAIRELSHLNLQTNKKFLSEWSFLMQDYPLWKEMLSFDEI